MHQSRNDVVLISNESLEIWSSWRKRAPIPLNGLGDRRHDDLHTTLSFSLAGMRDSPRLASTLVEAVIWFRGLIFSIGGALTFQSAVNSAVVRGWSGRGHPPVTSVGISLRVRIVLPTGVITVKKCLTWYLKYIYIYIYTLTVYEITLVRLCYLILQIKIIDQLFHFRYISEL